ncbi:MAG TPA: N-acetylmuramoyl-L-alanine amidase-like domain-containing protein [Blastocatellia bacterium]
MGCNEHDEFSLPTRGTSPTAVISSGDSRELARLLRLVEEIPEIGERVSNVSAEWLGRPYIESPLDPGGDTESLRIDLEAFDCVTMVETAIAISISEDIDQFVDTLKKIRYHNGVVEWSARNHYMSDWLTNNVAIGVLQDLTTGPSTVEKIAVLNAVEGLPPKLTAFRYFPQENLGTISRRLRTGDLASFASLKPGLDVFHTGFLIVTGDGVVLRHASRSAGKVVDQSLDQFIAGNKMLGVLIARPVIPCNR